MERIIAAGIFHWFLTQEIKKVNVLELKPYATGFHLQSNTFIESALVMSKHEILHFRHYHIVIKMHQRFLRKNSILSKVCYLRSRVNSGVASTEGQGSHINCLRWRVKEFIIQPQDRRFT